MSRRSWVIDVCRTCDRLAVWPFCEHRDLYRDGRWTVSVVAHTTAKRLDAPAASQPGTRGDGTRDG